MRYLEHQTPVLLKKELIDIDIDTVSSLPDTNIIPPNPYQGLAAFGEEDAAFFFGRETFVDNLVQATQSQPLIAVIGPSGSGKSSVVFAGLVPHLQEEGRWLIESFRPGNQPFYQLACTLVNQLEPELSETKQLIEAAELAQKIQEGKVSLQQIVSRITELNPKKRFLLVADQFEELYTLCKNKEEIQSFADTLLTPIHQKCFTLVLTLRADFYGYVLSYRPWRDALDQFTPKLLSSMSREELQRTIEQPAQKLEVQLEAQLTQRILDDVGFEPGNLPLLEFALTRMWSLQQNRVLTHQAYDEIGGVKKAIANHAEQIYQQLNQTQQKQAQRIFLQLIRPGEGTEDTRRLATRAEVGEENWELVSYLAGYTARLVVTGRDNKSGEDTVEVVHEALIREWLTLREWMNANRQFRIWQERLKVAIHEWKTNNYDGGALLRGVPLTVAEDWLHKRSDELTLTERNFIQASIAKRDRQQRGIRAGITLVILASTAAIVSFFLLWQESQKQSILATIQTSKVLLSSNQQLEAMVEVVRAEKQFQKLLLGKADAFSQDFIRTVQQIVDEIQEYNRLESHTDDVLNISFSPDGKTIATASRDGTAKLWSADGQLLQTFKGHNGWVYSVSFSPDSKTIATASADGTAKLWSVHGQLLQSFKAHNDWVHSVSFSPDGKTIATASADGTAKLWSINAQLLQTLKGHKSRVLSVNFSPDGKTIATASTDGTAKLWSINAQLLKTFSGHKDWIWSVTFSPDGKTIATASTDGTAKLWNLNGQPLQSFEENKNEIRSISFSPDGKTIATAGADGTAKLWNLNGQLLQTFKGHKNQIRSISFSPDGKTIATTSRDGTAKLWRTEIGKLKTLLKGHENWVFDANFSPDGKTIVTASADNSAILWSIDGQLLHTLKGHSERVYKARFSPDSKTIATASWDGTVKLWNIQGQLLQTLKADKDGVNSVSFSPDGKIIATANKNGTVNLSSLDTKTNQIIKAHNQNIWDVSFSPDGKTIATASTDATTKLWSVDGQLLETLKGHFSSVYSVSFSPDGKLIATGSADGNAKLWNINGQLLQTLKGHSSDVFRVSFSPDGKTIATASKDQATKFWNLNGQEIQTFRGHTNTVLSVNFSPDSKKIVTSSQDATAIIWKLDVEIDQLGVVSCQWLKDYLKSNQNVEAKTRNLCQ
ncbi:WD-40 repeat-containing protein [Kalymmatonema gypsitolerans NIES-4073]|nr:WD-40 repeat-containing protein [Scytonema sp. NIES-4073]